MKATELRIGNLVEETHSGEFGKVDMVVLSIIERMSNHSYRPIPLTEEWLVRFGFEWMDEIAGYVDGDHCVFISHGGDCWFHPFCTNDKDCHIKIRYVHTLQNLCYSLTGEELELKP